MSATDPQTPRDPGAPAEVRTPFPFEILDVLGEGAFGAVCVARWINDPLQRQVALKVLKPEYVSNPKVLQRTRDEARLLSKLHHPNIVTVEALHEVDERPILVMELVRGLDLKTLLRRSPYGIPASVAMEVVRTTCVALQAAYEAPGDDGKPMRVIHRDIKPSNMLLTIHGTLKVVDFGIATGQFEGRESRTDSLVMGSRPYMAPERLDRSPDTPAVDIYSAGMSLYELITGHTMPLSVIPSQHDKSMGEHLEQLKPPGLAPAATLDLRRLLQRMCAYDIGFRPSARESALELGRLLDGLDPAHRITLDDFARDVVEPLYQERKRVPLKVALGKLQDKELITHALASRPSASGKGSRRRTFDLQLRPAVFIGAVLGLVASSSGAAVSKYFRSHTPRTNVVASTAGVRVWFPRDAHARVGTQSLAVPGTLNVPPGRQELDLTFDDGRTLRCSFEAADGVAARYVVERGVGGVSIDDGPAAPCREVSR